MPLISNNPVSSCNIHQVTKRYHTILLFIYLLNPFIPFNTVWCYISGEAEGEIWNWSLLWVKWITRMTTCKILHVNLTPAASRHNFGPLTSRVEAPWHTTNGIVEAATVCFALLLGYASPGTVPAIRPVDQAHFTYWFEAPFCVSYRTVVTAAFDLTLDPSNTNPATFHAIGSIERTRVRFWECD